MSVENTEQVLSSFASIQSSTQTPEKEQISEVQSKTPNKYQRKNNTPSESSHLKLKLRTIWRCFVGRLQKWLRIGNLMRQI